MRFAYYSVKMCNKTAKQSNRFGDDSKKKFFEANLWAKITIAICMRFRVV